MTDTAEKTPPTKEIGGGSCKAAIGENESDGRASFSVTFSRLYHTDDGWRSTGSFGPNDLPHLAMLAHRAHQAVEDLTPESARLTRALSGSLAGPFSYDRRTPPHFCHHYRHAFASWPFSKSHGTTTVRSHTPEPHSPPRGGEWGWERPPSDLTIYSPGIRANAHAYFRGRGRSQPAPTARLIPAGRLLPRG